MFDIEGMYDYVHLTPILPILQSVFGEDAYPTVEEKAAHLLYFVVKNHPFNDGNKRCGAFSFIWLLKRAGFNVEKFINPNALTALTLLIAESNPNDKDRIGWVGAFDVEGWVMGGVITEIVGIGR